MKICEFRPRGILTSPTGCKAHSASDPAEARLEPRVVRAASSSTLAGPGAVRLSVSEHKSKSKIKNTPCDKKVIFQLTNSSKSVIYFHRCVKFESA